MLKGASKNLKATGLRLPHGGGRRLTLEEIRRKGKRRVIGLMSGTSADGVSAALVEIAGYGVKTKVKLLSFKNVPYSQSVREKIFELFNPKTSTVDKICYMNFVIGHIFAEAALAVAAEANIDIAEVDLIGSHGQTIYHAPTPTQVDGYVTKSTLQIGELAVIAEKTGVASIGDFRKKDVAAGGEGAPLVAYVDYILHRSLRVNRLFQNIGGIANLTFIPVKARPEDVIAFDTGPGTMVIDGLVKHYTKESMGFDEDGKLARKGMVVQSLLDSLLKNPFFKKNPPKSTGREMFGEHYVAEIISRAERDGLKKEDVVATLTNLTAETIVMAYKDFIMKKHKIDEVYLSGGGARNPVIFNILKEKIAPIKLMCYDELGIPAEAKEAVCFAVLANEHLMNIPANLKNVTGAKRSVVLGTLTPP